MLVRVALSPALWSNTSLSVSSDSSLIPELKVSTPTSEEGARLAVDSFDLFFLPEFTEFCCFLCCFLVAVALDCDR